MRKIFFLSALLIFACSSDDSNDNSNITFFEKYNGIVWEEVTEFVTNKSHPRPELLLKIATALDVDLKDLFISTKPQKNPKEIIGTIRDAINDLEALYDAKDTA
jgi:hypothetical protein